ncbi:Breast carcinoma-amplified sequence 3 [Auxenochlorella protothecoides]|uniref:Breast carcinoma-amplified sequence 3 n=1 Tax=Auxenochlorella protothecoides TaxID=3075 RepID=A0A087SJ49_AUXPR|nr:Breast carcinoma-amplified sequence 3 [Auxenochlorella protothecoides]KFM25753.1 Breast carcinoma-amplified sequence 3 [Auxenochlorella protothecoides]
MEAYRDRARQLAGRSLVVGLSALSSAGSKVARAAVAGVGALTATDREKVTAVRFASLEGQGGSPVLLVAYETGFQVWSLENSSEPLELVSRRDGPVRLLDMLAPPAAPAMAVASVVPDSPLAGMHPVLVLAPGSTPAHPDPPPALRFYSLRSHATVHSLALSAPALALAASRRLLLISFPGQLAAFDAVTLEQKFTCLAYSPPSLPHPSVNSNGHEAATPLPAAVPFALGPAWLAYPSPQLAAWRGGQGHAASAGAGIGAGPGPGSGAEGPVAVADALVPGTVVVREVGGLRVVAHFRAHTSALAALAFDPSGMLLATASTAGRSVRVWRVVTPTGRAAGAAPDATARPSPVQCLACLVRGLTPASIQGLAFSPDTRSDGEAPGGASPAAPTSVPALREAERWDLGRRYGWLEREGEVAGSPGEDSDAAVDGERHADAAGVQEDGAASPRERQRWLAQVEPVWGYWPEPELALRAAVRLCPQGSAA